MEYLVGIILASVVSLGSTFVGFDRDRAFYPVVMVVIASYYDLFAVMGGSTDALMSESAAMAVFVAAAVVGFRRNLWLVACALVGHGIFDFVHGHLIVNPGVPSWWPMFCMTYDVVAGLYLAALLWRSRVAALAR